MAICLAVPLMSRVPADVYSKKFVVDLCLKVDVVGVGYEVQSRLCCISNGEASSRVIIVKSLS